MKWLLPIILLHLAIHCQCQSDSLSYRPKIVEFSTEQNWNTATSYQSALLGNASGRLTDILWKIKFAAPLILENDKLFGIQFTFQKHEFEFEPDVEYPLFDHIEEKNITNLGLRALYQKEVKDGCNIILLGGYELKSDRLVWNRNTNQMYFSSTYTVKKNSRTLIGGGIYVGRSLGVFVIAPVIIYERIFFPNWALDIKFPKSAGIRRQLNAKSYLIGQAEAKTFRYNLTESIESEMDELTFRKADVQLTLNYEREIHDWLWFGITAGYNKNVRYFLAEPGGFRRDALVQLNAKANPFTKFSIFIVPPRKFYN